MIARLAALLALLALALAASGCSYVTAMSPQVKRKAAADTLYVRPVRAAFVHKGFIFNAPDTARIGLIERSADEILLQELRRAFPAAAVLPASAGLDTSRAVVVACRVKGFRRTIPREVASEFIDVLELITSFGLSEAYPLLTTSNVYLEIRNPALPKPLKMKHRDMVAAYDREDLRFQIRKILDPAWRG
jgi:hypothetical protein